MVKIGDKVRFLNSVGGGTVVKQVNKDLVLVEEEDGFETPVLMRECVVIEQASASKPNDSRPAGVSRLAASVPESPYRQEEKEKELPVFETPEGERLNILLAFVPENAKSLQNTHFDGYLVNDSNYYVFFTYMCKAGDKWKLRYSGTVEPNIKLHIEEFGKEDLNDLERICIQYVAYKQDKPFDLKNTASVEHRLDTVKFYKLHSFRENDYFDEEAIVCPIVRNDVPEISRVVSAAELENSIKTKKSDDYKPEKQPIVKKKKEGNAVVEVDLHIEELIDSTLGMSNADILNYQLDKFRETMEQYKSNKGSKIVFIHGKGDGVLRNAIVNELRTKYKSCYFQDASFREYGFGATMVTIK